MPNNKPVPHKSKSEWMITYVTHNVTDAHIVAGRLRSEGIAAMVDHMVGRGAFGITIGNMGEVRVLVHPDNYERSQLILYPDELDELPDQTGDIIYRWEDNDDE
jgi:hypothetical protein